MKFFRVFLLALFLASCGSLQRPNFVGPGELQSPLRSPTNYSPGVFTLTWPIERVAITQEFSPPRNPRHQGVDFAGPKNSDIYAAHEGVVVYAGHDFSGYGNMVLVEYSKKWATLYAHLNSIRVKEGDYVSPGTLIGYMGRTGRATGVHLHFELMKNKIPVDPLTFLNSERSFVSH